MSWQLRKMEVYLSVVDFLHINDKETLILMKPLQLTWDLESIFAGGSSSPQFSEFLASLVRDLAQFSDSVKLLDGKTAETSAWADRFNDVEDLSARIRTSAAFISCLLAQDVNDAGAKLLHGRILEMNASFHSALTTINKELLEVPDEKWNNLLRSDRFEPLQFILNERRRRAGEQLGQASEQLAGDLGVDGYHAWSSLYNALIGRMSLSVELEGVAKQVSIGQANNLLSHKERSVRADIFNKLEDDFAKDGELFAAALNHLAGFRIQLYKHRGWESAVREPLDINRMKPETLDVMWETITKNKAVFVKYLNRKAKLLGLDKLSWFDLRAPLGSSDSKLSYDEGAAFIVDQFERFSPRLAQFAEKAFEDSWIEAEDRTGKRPGGFCTSFPLHHQCRIFLTYNGAPSTLATLAHELGHAYHREVMDDLPVLLQGYAMNVAETASTFAEMIVADASLRNAKTNEERIVLLDDKLERSIAFFMDIHSRFLFETRFYEERKKGLVSVERLNDLMTEAQREAFCGALDQVHPYFWASKMHFYNTSVPFYNFPYTFGYLFSAGIYARAYEEGQSFEAKYTDLLRDTGRMQVEDLAQKHLGVDLTRPEFWQSAIDRLIPDVEEFLALTEPRERLIR
jgi:oligoendopeptidase F